MSEPSPLPAIRDGDEIAFAEVYQAAWPRVLAACRSCCRSQADAEDAAQAAFIDLVRQADRIADDSDVTAWLITVARRHAMHSLRAETRRRRRERAFACDQTRTEASRRSPRDLAPHLRAALLRLDVRWRRPLELHYLHGATIAETAACLGICEGTANSTLARARKRLARLLGRDIQAHGAGAIVALLGEPRLRDLIVDHAAALWRHAQCSDGPLPRSGGADAPAPPARWRCAWTAPLVVAGVITLAWSIWPTGIGRDTGAPAGHRPFTVHRSGAEDRDAWQLDGATIGPDGAFGFVVAGRATAVITRSLPPDMVGAFSGSVTLGHPPGVALQVRLRVLHQGVDRAPAPPPLPVDWRSTDRQLVGSWRQEGSSGQRGDGGGDGAAGYGEPHHLEVTITNQSRRPVFMELLQVELAGSIAPPRGPRGRQQINTTVPDRRRSSRHPAGGRRRGQEGNRCGIDRDTRRDRSRGGSGLWPGRSRRR